MKNASAPAFVAVIALFFIVFFLPCYLHAENYIECIQVGDKTVQLDIYNPAIRDCPVAILLHGGAGISGDRAVRYKNFATDLMEEGILAINVHYFDVSSQSWQKAIYHAIDYAEAIPNANKSKIALVGYSLGGSLAFTVAAKDDRVMLLAVNNACLPLFFNKREAAKLPKTLMISGSKDSSIRSLFKLYDWRKEQRKPFLVKINEGYGHSVPMDIFEENWRAILSFLKANLL
ncbi:MAG: alpha/beta hydrolase [Candidatus Omnitrophica bacterium]|nr:alpha/beta hydrolase [Candidatus Omnitrophota bacterium]